MFSISYDLLLRLKSQTNLTVLFGSFDGTITGYWVVGDKNEFSEIILPIGLKLFGLFDGNVESNQYPENIGKHSTLFRVKGNVLESVNVGKSEYLEVRITEKSHLPNIVRFTGSYSFERVDGLVQTFQSIATSIDEISQTLVVCFESGYMLNILDVGDSEPTIQDLCNGYTADLQATSASLSQSNSNSSSKNKTAKKGKKQAKSNSTKKQVVSIKLPTISTAPETKPYGNVYNVTGISISSPNALCLSSSTQNVAVEDISSIRINYDILIYTNHTDKPAQHILDLIKEGLLRQTEAALSQLQSLDLTQGGVVGAYHYFIPVIETPITLMHVLKPTTIPNNNAPEQLSSLSDEGTRGYESRKRLHIHFGLPLNKPIFRLQCAETFSAPSPSTHSPDTSTATTVSTRLRNVHVGIPGSGLSGGREYLVDGGYLYYHYLQDGLNDKGWGCAYRSLQTLVSWFVSQHYTDQQVPSHTQIQECLVRIGDKSPSFIGSHEWIGSMEVGFYLDAELGIQWRNISVSNGPELATKARELALHFQEQGTPVMMGGGNLAFTCLGVAWNESTGDVKFLILDPHYTGPDELSQIQQKACMMEGYKARACEWRSASTFSKTSFYNLCLPLRPSDCI